MFLLALTGSSDRVGREKKRASAFISHNKHRYVLTLYVCATQFHATHVYTQPRLVMFVMTVRSLFCLTAVEVLEWDRYGQATKPPRGGPAVQAAHHFLTDS